MKNENWIQSLPSEALKDEENVGCSNVSSTAKISIGQRSLSKLSMKAESIINTLILGQRQADLARFYFELTIQDEIPPSSAESIDCIWQIAEEDSLLSNALIAIDALVSDAITSFRTYDASEIREEYASLWKKEELDESDYERISFILTLARTDEMVGAIVDDVDRAFLNANYYVHSELCQHHKNAMAKAMEYIGRQEGIERNASEICPNQSGNEYFVGREEVFEDIKEKINYGTKIFFVHGLGGVGKSSLCKQFLRDNFEQVIEFPTACEVSDLVGVEELVEEQIIGLGEIPCQDFQSSLSKIKRLLKTRRIGVLIDNLETVINREGTFIDTHRKYVKLLQFLSASETRSVTFITSRKRLNYSELNLSPYELKGLGIHEWKKFFECSGLTVAPNDLRLLHLEHAGNAKAMELLCRKILLDASFDTFSYCFNLRKLSGLYLESKAESDSCNSPKISTSLRNLVASEFDSLERHDDGIPYRLLVRLGCCRYQEVSTFLDDDVLPYLLWDTPASKKSSAIQALLERSLVSFIEGKGYFLHPIIRQEAMQRLLLSDDWVLSNKMAAFYWTQKATYIESSADALKALEAHHHYLNIGAYAEAANVLIRKRKNSFGTNESLMRSLYKLGLLMHTEEAIKKLNDEDIDEYQRVKLTHTLGALSWLKGNVQEAVNYCYQVHSLVDKFLPETPKTSQGKKSSRALQIIDLNAYLTTGISHLGAWRIEESLASLYKVVELASCLDTNSIDNSKYDRCALFYISYIHSLEEHGCDSDVARITAEKLFHSWNQEEMPSWLTEYRLYYLGLAFTNLGQLEKSLAIHTTVLDSEFHSVYKQAKTKHINGLACCYRAKKMFEDALLNHSRAIASFQSIGARIDLAEAYFQQAITLYEVGDYKLSTASVSNASSIFREMKTDKQQQRLENWLEKNNLLCSTPFLS